MASDRFWTTKFAWARYAIAWILYAWMRAVVLLPFGWQVAAGKALGRMTYRLLPRRRRVVERNLAACFPALGAADRDRLAREHFAALGASLAEMATGWFGRPSVVQRRVTVNGGEHLRAALDGGSGVILLSAHFTTFEFYWAAVRPLCTRLTGMYKYQRNPVMNRVMNLGRGRYFDHLFDKDSVREMLRELKRNSVVWYAPDQSYSGKGSALLPFFGEPAMTNTAIGRIAKASGAAVLPYFCRRIDSAHYEVDILPPLADFPSGDDVADMRRFTKLLEDYIRLCPEQYWWIHQRFKGRPAPLPDLYAAPRTP
jgi:KDO2-lipid IV(A) lauroyltransferase